MWTWNKFSRCSLFFFSILRSSQIENGFLVLFFMLSNHVLLYGYLLFFISDVRCWFISDRENPSNNLRKETTNQTKRRLNDIQTIVDEERKSCFSRSVLSKEEKWHKNELTLKKEIQRVRVFFWTQQTNLFYSVFFFFFSLVDRLVDVEQRWFVESQNHRFSNISNCQIVFIKYWHLTLIGKDLRRRSYNMNNYY